MCRNHKNIKLESPESTGFLVSLFHILLQAYSFGRYQRNKKISSGDKNKTLCHPEVYLPKEIKIILQETIFKWLWNFYNEMLNWSYIKFSRVVKNRATNSIAFLKTSSLKIWRGISLQISSWFSWDRDLSPPNCTPSSLQVSGKSWQWATNHNSVCIHHWKRWLHPE